MNFPENIEQKLGFDKIREKISSSCRSELGQKEVEKVKFSNNTDLIIKLCRQTEEFSKILSSSENYLPINQIDSLQSLNKIKIAGSFIDSGEINEIRIFLEGVIANLKFFKDKKETYPLLYQLSENHFIDEKLPEIIYQKIDDKGEIRDSATPELRDIRRNIVSYENKARNVVNKVIASAKKSGFTPEDASLTIRNGRLVIPVKAEHKRQLKGFIHDESASGQTTYIEPAEVLEINNEIKELFYQERREIVKILIGLCDKLREDFNQLDGLYRFSAIVDFIRAKAIYANGIDAITPEISKKKLAEFYKARHPILEANLTKQKRKIVPLDIVLNEDQRILVISGPNAGGKSVTLKTLGLLQYMFQCGFPIPVGEGSKVSFFSQIFIDIGDEQSIENDLSTYSSHLQNMAHFVKFANKNTLFLIDEFGTGTDPKFGGAIAESILTELKICGAYGALSTHYSNLKKFADHKKGIANARMRYDVARLEPLFQLETGKPGSSFALEIASKIGLPKQIIDQARNKIGVDEVQMDNLLNELEREKEDLIKKLESAEKKEKLLDISLKSYEQLKEELENKKKEIINNAKLEAQNLLSGANQKIEAAIFDIKKSNAQKETIKKQKETIEKLQTSLKPEEIRKTLPFKILKGPIHPGDRVRIKGQETIGEVISVGKKSAEVSFGSIKTKTQLNKLEKVDARSEGERPNYNRTKAVNFDINDAQANFSPTLDLRGKRAEEAQSLVTHFMDQGIMYSLPSLKIIHGKGNGILRSLVRGELKKYKEIERVEDEHADRGGDGVSIIYLN